MPQIASNRGTDEWEAMRERLMGLTLKQLRQTARDEGITLGYAASRKDTCVGAIVSARRARARANETDKGAHPWRKWRSVKTMGAHATEAR